MTSQTLISWIPIPYTKDGRVPASFQYAADSISDNEITMKYFSSNQPLTPHWTVN